jgi:hypothetical protein
VAAKFEEPCAFKLLKILATDDEAGIISAYEKVKGDHANWCDSPKPYEREFFRKILLAGATLKDSNKRGALIEYHKQVLFEVVNDACGALSGSITTDFFDRMVRLGQNDSFHLAPHLAKQVVETVLKTRGVMVGGPAVAPQPPAPPALVADLRVTAGGDYPRLQWKRPEKGCDRVRIVGKSEGFPVNEADGYVVFEGLSDDCIDDKAVPGKSCYYAAFSYSGSQSSSPACSKAKHFFADGIKDLTSRGTLGQIEISWAEPPGNVVAFRAPAGGLCVERPAGLFPVERPGTKRLGLKKATRLVDRAADGIEPGRPYEYLFFVDYGTVDSRREYSAGQSVTETAVAAAEPVRDVESRSEATGVRLVWKRPERFCDHVMVVRSADNPPKDEKDGEPVAQSAGDSCVDGNVIPGATYYYSVFSFHAGYASARVQKTHLYAGPAAGFGAANPLESPGRIRLKWNVPGNCKRMKLFRRAAQKPEVSADPRTGEPRLGIGEDRSGGLGEGAFEEAVEPGVTYHYYLYALYSDGQWSGPAYVSSSALEPARAAAPPVCAVTAAGDVRLSWPAADPAKLAAYRYRIWRRAVSRPGSFSGLQEIGQTQELSFTDYAKSGAYSKTPPPMPGVHYEYAVQTVVGPVESAQEGLAWSDVFVTRAVAMKSVIGTDRGVRLDWEPPPNIARAQVVRKSGDNAVAVPSETSRAIDGGLTNGATYTYAITAVFADAAGKEYFSASVDVTATPVLAAEPANRLSVAYESGVVRLSWEPSQRRPDGYLVSRLSEEPAASVGQNLDASTIAAISRLPGTASAFDDHDAPSRSIGYYALYSLAGSTATFCGSVLAVLVTAVGSPEAGNRGRRMWLRWQWPQGIDTVAVYRRSSGSSAAARRIGTCNRHQYDAATAYVDDIEATPAIHTYQIRSLCEHRGKAVESLLFAEVRAIGGVLPEVRYDVDKTRKGIAVTCDLRKAGRAVRGLLLVRNGSREPKDWKDGEIVAQWSATKGGPENKVQLLDASKPRRAYYRVFLAASSALEHWAAIVDPPYEDRRVEF